MFHYLHRANVEKSLRPSRFFIGNHFTPRLKYSMNQSTELTKIIIKEIHYEHPLLFFCTDKGQIHCFNTEISVIITIDLFSTEAKSAKSITLNKQRNSLVIVYVNRRDNIQELKCEEISLETIHLYLFNNLNSNREQKAIQYEDFTSLFEREVFISPAFIEFDEINRIILTKNSLGTFKVWSMKTYKALFEITDRRIEEVRLSEDILLTIMATNVIEKIILIIHSIHNGKILFRFEIDLIRNSSLIFLELFSNVLFLKQENHIPLFVDLLSLDCFFLNEDFNEEAYFVFINTKRTMIAFNVNEVLFYGLEGNLKNRIKTENAIEAIMPPHFSVSSDKNYLATFWKMDGRFQDEEILRRQSRTNSDVSLVYLSQDSKAKIVEKNEFKCSLSSIGKRSNVSNQSSTIKNQFNYQSNLRNKLDIFSLDIDDNKPIASIQLKLDMEVSGLVFDSSLMVIYFITIYGDIYLINL